MSFFVIFKEHLQFGGLLESISKNLKIAVPVVHGPDLAFKNYNNKFFINRTTYSEWIITARFRKSEAAELSSSTKLSVTFHMLWIDQRAFNWRLRHSIDFGNPQRKQFTSRDVKNKPPHNTIFQRKHCLRR